MFINKNQTRRRKSSRRKTKSLGRKKTSQNSIIPALIIESMAVVAILVLFFGVRADLRNQSKTKTGWEAKPNASEFAGRDRRVGALAQPMISGRKKSWASWSMN